MKNGLRTRREAVGLSQGEPAEAVGVTRQTINATERERYDPSFEPVFKLAVYFDYRVGDLFDPELDADLIA